MDLPASEAPPAEFTERPITERQVIYLTDLLRKRNLLTSELAEKIIYLDRNDASRWIKKALSIPAVATQQWPKVPDGHYAIRHQDGELRFYRVQTGAPGSRWEGRRFLDIQAGDEFHKYNGNVQNIIDCIGADPKSASLEYGLAIGQCGVCHRTLTNKLSRRIGIGPICRRRMGW